VTHRNTVEVGGRRYQMTVAAGLDWLVARQKASTTRGLLDRDMYAHSLATVALCEAYALSGDARYKAPAQLAVDYLVAAQHKKGGWRYTAGSAGDLSVTGFALRALLAGKRAGLKVPAETWNKAARFIDSTESEGGAFGYLPGSPGRATMTAVGWFCRSQLGGRGADLRPGVKVMAEAPPRKDDSVFLYHAYYAARFFFEASGKAWEEWNVGPKGKRGMRDTLIALQDRGGRAKGNRGSWAGNDHVGGRIGATSLAVLTLQVYYRYPRAAEQAARANKE
jgi:Pectic acid lyase